MLQSNALATLSTAQTYLGNNDASFTNFLELAINTVSACFDSTAGYQLISKSYTEVFLNGSGTPQLRFPARNVTAVSAVEYRTSKADWEVLSADVYDIDATTRNGIRGYGGYRFLRGFQNWRASFTAGWEQEKLPGDIVEVFLYELKRFVERRPDIASQDIGGQSSSGKTYTDLHTRTLNVLQNYSLKAI